MAAEKRYGEITCAEICDKIKAIPGTSYTEHFIGDFTNRFRELLESKKDTYIIHYQYALYDVAHSRNMYINLIDCRGNQYSATSANCAGFVDGFTTLHYGTVYLHILNNSQINIIKCIPSNFGREYAELIKEICAQAASPESQSTCKMECEIESQAVQIAKLKSKLAISETKCSTSVSELSKLTKKLEYLREERIRMHNEIISLKKELERTKIRLEEDRIMYERLSRPTKIFDTNAPEVPP